MIIRIVNRSRCELIKYITKILLGMDLRVRLDLPIKLVQMENTMVTTGLFIGLPVGIEVQLRVRK